MESSIVSKEFEEYQNEINAKFIELENTARNKIASLSSDDLSEYKKVIADQQKAIKTKVAAYRSIKTGALIEKEFWNDSVKPYLVSFGISPIEKEKLVEYTNAKGEKQTKFVVQMLNNLKSGWNAGDRDAAILDILLGVQIPTTLRNAIQDNDLDKEIMSKYKMYFDAASEEAKDDFKINNLTIDKHVLKLKKNRALADFKMTCINTRENEIKLIEANRKKQERQSTLNTLCKSSIRYNTSTSMLAKKYCIQ